MSKSTLLGTVLYVQFEALKRKAVVRNVCSGGCLSQLLNLFFRTIRWQCSLLPRDPGRTRRAARAIRPSLVWTSVMRPLRYTLHIYFTHRKLCSENLVSCRISMRPSDKPCIVFNWILQPTRPNAKKTRFSLLF